MTLLFLIPRQNFLEMHPCPMLRFWLNHEKLLFLGSFKFPERAMSSTALECFWQVALDLGTIASLTKGP